MRGIDPSALDSQLFRQGFLEGSNASELRAIGDVFRALLRAKYVICLALTAGAVTGFVLSKVLDEEFTSTASVMVDTRVRAAGGVATGDTILPLSLTSLESEAEVLRSLDLVERVIDTLGLQADPEFAPAEDDLAVSGEPTVNEGDGSALTFVDQARSFASDLMAQIVPLESNLPAAQEFQDLDALINKQKVIQAVAEQRSVEQLSSVSAVYNISFTSLDRVKAALIANTFAEQYLAIQLQTKIDSLNRSTHWLTDRVQELNARLIELTSRFETHQLEAPFPVEEELIDARAQRSRLGTRLSRARSSGAAPANIAELEAALEALSTALAKQATFEAEAKRMESDVQVTEAIYSNVVAQLSALQQQDDLLRTDAQIISAARLSVWPSAPKRTQLIVLGGVIGALVSGLIVALLELRQRNLRSVSDFEEASGLPVISLIPKSQGRESPIRAITQGRILKDDRLTKSARKLRSSIRVTGRDQQIVAFVSAFQGEGKSATALLFAQACAQTGERTLLLDLDFWRSAYRRTARRDSPGFHHVIEIPKNIDEYLVNLEDNLIILPALQNTQDPSDLPYSKNFKELITYLRTKYDRIVVDLPPILPMLDFATMVSVADVSVLVVRWNSTPKSAVKSAIQVLHDVGVTPFAVVPTMVEAKKARGYSDDAFSYAHKRYHADYAS